MKFGGASVQRAASFLQLAQMIVDRSVGHPHIIVVVSAMAHTTDQLVSLAKSVNPTPPDRELDMLLTVGERVSISLLAMALAKVGKSAVSFTGSQSGIITNDHHSNARIVEVRPRRILEALDKGKIAIVAGFQGMSMKGEITTLGRGGSDTSAVALAVAVGAPRVEFYKDVPGVFERDPKVDPNAKFFPVLSFQEALHIVASGAKILAPRCIELAEKNGIELCIRSFLNPKGDGTVVGVSQKRLNCYEVPACSLN